MEIMTLSLLRNQILHMAKYLKMLKFFSFCCFQTDLLKAVEKKILEKKEFLSLA